MVDLAEPVVSISFQVNDKAATQVVLNFDHVASHGTVLTLDESLSQGSKLRAILECVLVCR